MNHLNSVNFLQTRLNGKVFVLTKCTCVCTRLSPLGCNILLLLDLKNRQYQCARNYKPGFVVLPPLHNYEQKQNTRYRSVDIR